MKVFHILFLPVNERNKRSHLADSTAFSRMKNLDLRYLRVSANRETPENNSVFYFRGPLSLARYVRKEKPDLVFLPSFIFPIQTLLLRAFLPAGTKMLIQHHAEQPFTNSLKLFLQKRAYRHANGYLFTAVDQAKSFISKKIIPDLSRVHEVMEGSTHFTPGDMKKARIQLGIENGTVFLWVGRLDQNKDPLTVLRAFSDLLSVKKTWKLYMIYSENELEREVRQFINEKKLRDHVILTGLVEHHLMETWYRAADFFVSGSHSEGSGYALCEAMACGCIPIVTRIPSFEKMTRRGEAGILYKAGDAEDLLDKLCKLPEDEKESYSQKVLDQFRDELSFDAIGRKLEAILSGLRK